MRSEPGATHSHGTDCSGADDPSMEPRLSELGNRLRYEAVRLSARYATKPPRTLVHRARPRSFAGIGLVLVAASALAVVVVAPPWSRNSMAPPFESSQVAVATSPTQTPFVAEEGPSGIGASAGPEIEAAMAGQFTAAPPDLESPVFLLDVSDPELEALLDLWEEERPHSTRLSI